MKKMTAKELYSLKTKIVKAQAKLTELQREYKIQTGYTYISF